MVDQVFAICKIKKYSNVRFLHEKYRQQHLLGLCPLLKFRIEIGRFLHSEQERSVILAEGSLT